LVLKCSDAASAERRCRLRRINSVFLRSPRLTSLRVQDGVPLADLRGLAIPWSQLRNLEVDRHPHRLDRPMAGFSASSSLRACTSLLSLRIDGRLDSLSNLAPLSATLTDLTMGSGPWVVRLEALTALTALTCMVLERSIMPHNADLQVFSSCPSLRTLAINSALLVSDVAPLAACIGLRSLAIAEGTYINASRLATLTGLMDLRLSTSGHDVRALKGVTSLTALVALDRLDLSYNCMPENSVSSLADLTTVRHLSLRGCRHLEDLSPMSARGVERPCDTGPQRLSVATGLHATGALHGLATA
jgi:hypothetical protein